jgi:hypothetical protein
MLGDGAVEASASLVLIVGLVAVGGGAMAEEIETPAEQVCVGVDDTADCERAALATGGDAGGGPLGVVAVSGTGDTSAGLLEVNGMNDADGCVAVSGTGDADASCPAPVGDRSLEASGCQTGQAAGTEAACAGPDEHEQVAEVLTCGTDLATSDDGEAHAFCAIDTGSCVQVVWGTTLGPFFVGGHHGCEAGA